MKDLIGLLVVGAVYCLIYGLGQCSGHNMETFRLINEDNIQYSVDPETGKNVCGVGQCW